MAVEAAPQEDGDGHEGLAQLGGHVVGDRDVEEQMATQYRAAPEAARRLAALHKDGALREAVVARYEVVQVHVRLAPHVAQLDGPRGVARAMAVDGAHGSVRVAPRQILLCAAHHHQLELALVDVATADGGEAHGLRAIGCTRAVVGRRLGARAAPRRADHLAV